MLTTLKDLFLICLAMFALLQVDKLFHRKRTYLRKKGIPTIATVIRISKTSMYKGTGFSQSPLMTVTLEFETDGVCQQVTIDQFLDPRDIPNVGDKVNILVDPRNSKNILIA
jgi:hypothetical protein